MAGQMEVPPANKKYFGAWDGDRPRILNLLLSASSKTDLVYGVV